MFRKLFIFFFASSLSLPLWAVPVISGAFTSSGGVGAFLSTTGGTMTVGRAGLINPANNLASIESTLGLSAGTLDTLPGNPFRRAGVVFQTFTGGLQGEGIEFTASATNFTLLTGVTPTYGYFATLDPLFGALPTIFVPLALTNTPQTFRIDLPASGDYLFGFGAVRNNPNPGVLGSYGTITLLTGVIGVEKVPELDAHSATLPCLISLGLLLGLRRRQQKQTA